MRFLRPGAGDTHLDEEGRRALDAWERVRSLGSASPGDGAWREWQGRRNRRRVRSVAGGIIGALLLVASLAAGFFGGRWTWGWVRNDTGLLRVQQAVVTGASRITPREILAAGEIGVGQDILSIDPAAAAARIAALPLVRKAEVRRTFSRQVLVTIEERRPRALAMLDRIVEVDEEGVVLPPDPSGTLANLPIIRGLGMSAPKPGERLAGSGSRAAVELAAQLADSGVALADAVSEIWAANPDSLVLILMKDAVPVKIGRGGLPRRRLQAFRIVLDNLAGEEQELEYVDLRFSGQVVVKHRPTKAEVTEPSAPGKAPAVITHDAGRKGRRTRHGRNT